jgi:hypothetical protein
MISGCRGIWGVAVAFIVAFAGFAATLNSASGIPAADTAETSPFAPRVVSESGIHPPTAIFNFERHRSFYYSMEVDSAALESASGGRTKILYAGIGRYPRQQRVTRSSRSALGDTTAVVLIRQATFRNPRAGLTADTVPHFLREISSASIDPQTGSIIGELPPDSGMSRNDALPGEERGFCRTLWEFYGQWMLHVSDTFSYEKVILAPPVGEVRISLETVGRDTIDGRDCYLVRYRRRSAGTEGLEKMYWIDAAQRVTARVQDEGITMRLVTPVRKSSATGP